MGIQWRKSAYTGGVNDNQCVELGRLGPEIGIGVRDSKNPDGGHLTLTVGEFAALLARIKRTTSP